MVKRVIVIGASLSGVMALQQLVRRLPANLPAAVLITQHVAAHTPGFLPQLLSIGGALPAIHPADGTMLEEGHVYVAPPDRHMLITSEQIHISHGPKENLTRPAIDPLFRSAALAFGNAVIAVVLTGQLDDGTAGLLAVKDRGGIAIVQDPDEATAPSMPLSALRHVPVDHCCKLDAMPALLAALCTAEPPADPDVSELLMQIEGRIAGGDFRVDDWWQLERMSTPSGFNCPECRSAVYEMNDKRVLRFRCRSGHAYSAESLASGQSEARYDLLSSIYGAMIEESTLLRRLAGASAYAESFTAPRRSAEAARLDTQVRGVCEWLRSMAGLVETELEPPPRKG